MNLFVDVGNSPNPKQTPFGQTISTILMEDPATAIGNVRESIILRERPGIACNNKIIPSMRLPGHCQD